MLLSEICCLGDIVKIFFTPLQWRLIEALLYLASRFTTNAMSVLVLFARYISALMTLRYVNSGPNIPLLHSLVSKWICPFLEHENHRSFGCISFFHIEFLWYLLHISRLVYENTHWKVLSYKPKKILVLLKSFILNYILIWLWFSSISFVLLMIFK
jgi:hypothetical protein